MLILKNYKLVGSTPKPVNYSIDDKPVVLFNKTVALFESDIEYKEPVLIKKEGVPFPIVIEKEELEQLIEKENKNNKEENN